MNKIRNFVIIAHIDHGKSTLADRFLEITGTVEPRQMKAQYLDQLELERERGITIKMAPVRMVYKTRTDADKTQTVADKTKTRTASDNELLYEDFTYKIRGAVFSVRKQLELGHKEVVYQKALEIEFRKIGLNFEREKNIDVFYDKQKVGVYRPDFIIENKILIELKTLLFIGKQEEKQIWNYLRGTPYELALLINFSPKRADIYRIINSQSRENCPQLSALSPQESAYILNLIDTPGHPDFSYEVSRALAAVEGAILLVDATQGIQAQTLANFYAAKRTGLKIIGAVNKVDLNPPQIHQAIKETADLIGCSPEEIHRISAKTGEGVEKLLATAVKHIPPPKSNMSVIGLRALIFDSFYDDHRGVVASVRIFDGEVKNGDEIHFVAANINSKIKEIGYFTPHLKPAKLLTEGEIGYIATGIKDPQRVKIGDTIITNKHKLHTNNTNQISEISGRFVNIRDLALKGYQEPKPVVFVSFYPVRNDISNGVYPDTTRTHADYMRTNADKTDYDDLKRALQKLQLNDSALKFEPDFNEVLGRGFKGGFLGKLHFEITAERLEREFKIKTINSFPSVSYKVKVRGLTQTGHGQERTDKSEFITIENPADLPDKFEEIQEPMVALKIISPAVYLGNIFQLKEIFRMENVQYQEARLPGIDDNLGRSDFQKLDKVLITAKMPLAELIYNFDDRIKSVSQGFASFSYELVDYQKADLKKLEILVAGEPVAGLVRIFPAKRISFEARKMVEQLKEFLPRQQFSQAIQAVADNRIIARETIPALKKDVAGYLYGGDRTRKMKLWKKQKAGKKKLKEMGRVKISAEIFKKMIK